MVKNKANLILYTSLENLTTDITMMVVVVGAGRFTAVFAPRSKKGYAEEKRLQGQEGHELDSRV